MSWWSSTSIAGRAAISDREAYVARLDRVLARADVVKASDEDLAWLSADGSELVQQRPAGRPRDAGDAGTMVRRRRVRPRSPSIAVPVVDTIGAGDAFTAGFISWWLASGVIVEELADLHVVERAVHAAHAVAAVVVGRRGADPPRREQLSAGWL